MTITQEELINLQILEHIKKFPEDIQNLFHLMVKTQMKAITAETDEPRKIAKLMALTYVLNKIQMEDLE